MTIKDHEMIRAILFGSTPRKAIENMCGYLKTVELTKQEFERVLELVDLYFSKEVRRDHWRNRMLKVSVAVAFISMGISVVTLFMRIGL